MGFRVSAQTGLHEVSREDAAMLLAHALSVDLCYGTRRLSLVRSRELVDEFMALFPDSARHYTNSRVPYQRNAKAWDFTPLMPGAMIDNGVLVRVDDELSGVL
jgi:hypothetical protein